MDIEKQIVDLIEKDEDIRYQAKKVERKQDYDYQLLLLEMKTLIVQLSDLDCIDRLKGLVQHKTFTYKLLEQRIEELEKSS